MDVDNPPFTTNKPLHFPPTSAERGDMGTAAALLGPAQGGRTHPSPLAFTAGDGSRGTKVPVHRPGERADLKAVVGDCLNISPFFFIRLRGFTVSVAPLRDPSSSLFGCEYLTSF